ncbi:MAG: 16S rRNA (guanine(527)-N(7))-methyltransferase RsmG [Kofleriaceae bacterium]
MTHFVNILQVLDLPSEIGNRLEQFSTLFAKWNERINLSAASSPAELAEHIRDSLHVVSHLRAATRIVDVGSGGGFPIIIAALCLPDAELVALEPTHKKHAFLRTAARELKLANLEARAERVEDHAGHDYDAACSRATFDLPEWFERGLALVRDGGFVVGFEAVPRTDLPAMTERHPYELDGKQRSIVLVRKTPS